VSFRLHFSLGNGAFEGLGVISPKQALKDFRAAAWPDKDAIGTFVRDLEPLGVGDVGKMLQMVCDPELTADGPRHVRRRFAFFAIARRALDPRLFTPYIEALERADEQTRAALVELCPKVNNADQHGKLVQALASPRPEVRRAAAQVARQVAGRSTLVELGRLFAGPPFPGRIEALEAVAPRVGPHAVPFITAVMEDGHPSEQVRALELLVTPEIRERAREAAGKVAAAALGARDAAVLERALDALAQIVGEDEFFERTYTLLDSPRADVVKGVIEALRRFGGTRTINVLRRKLRQGPNAVRQAVIGVLERIGSEEVLPLLVEALSSKHLIVRNAAAEVVTKLSTTGRVDVARAVIWLLRSHDINVRRIAAEIANRVEDPNGELGPRMLDYLTDEDWWVRERVMDALAKMWKTGLTRHVVGYLKNDSDVVRRFAIGALRRIKDPQALGALVRSAMSDPDWWVREAAIDAIAELKDDRARPYLLDMLAKQPDLRISVLGALKTLGAVGAGEAVAEMLSDADPDVRLAALRCLESFGDKSHGLWVKACENDLVPRVRLCARELLARWSVTGSAATMVVSGDSALERLLCQMVEAGGEDLIVAAGRIAYMKKLGEAVPLGSAVYTAGDMDALLVDLLGPTQREALADGRDADFSYDAKLTRMRFRANVFHQMSGLGAVFRAIRGEIADIASLGLPAVVHDLANLKHGLVLVGGPTGAGKSTTLAALVHHMNATQNCHILTLEDPIEVVHQSRQSLVNQREVGTHARGFDVALRSSLREDPDVILIGEMRDLDTISFAVTAAETGHLVFGTVHTVSADKSIDRIINAFPPVKQSQVRSMLADNLQAVVCQHLLRKKDQSGRVLAVEVLLGNDAVAALIRKGKTFQIPSVIATNGDIGMQSMDSQLARLVQEGVVAPEEAYVRAVDKSAFEALTGASADLGVPTSTRADAATPSTVPPPISGMAPSSPLPRESVVPVEAPSSAPPRARGNP
jgi:twitching motility protein PilT